jgi:hypothetical protein
LNDQNDDAFGLKDLRVGLTSQRLVASKKKILAAHDFQPWNLEIAFEGNPGSQRFKQFWQLSCIGIAWFCVMGR